MTLAEGTYEVNKFDSRQLISSYMLQMLQATLPLTKLVSTVDSKFVDK